MSPNSSRKKAVYSCLYVVTWNCCTPHIRVKKNTIAIAIIKHNASLNRLLENVKQLNHSNHYRISKATQALKVIRVAANKTDGKPIGKAQNKNTLGLRDVQYITHLRLKLHTLGHHCMLVHLLTTNQFSYFFFYDNAIQQNNSHQNFAEMSALLLIIKKRIILASQTLCDSSCSQQELGISYILWSTGHVRTMQMSA